MTSPKKKEWEERFDKLMGQRERLFKQTGNVIITDSKTVTYTAIKQFIRYELEDLLDQVERELPREYPEPWQPGIIHTSPMRLKTLQTGNIDMAYEDGYNFAVRRLRSAIKKMRENI